MDVVRPGGDIAQPGIEALYELVKWETLCTYDSWRAQEGCELFFSIPGGDAGMCTHNCEGDGDQ